MVRRVLQRFRTMNARWNECVFREGTNTHLRYLAWIRELVKPGNTILDLGAGSVEIGSYLPVLKAHRTLVVAVDRDHRSLAVRPPGLGVVGDADRLPFGDGTAHVITASCFFEHVEYPERVVAECYRVLKPGGTLVFYTPHRWSYVAVIARVTPMVFHRWVRALQTGKRAEEADVCPTYYRANTLAALHRLRGPFRVRAMDLVIGAPSYTTFLPPPLHGVAIMYHLLVSRVGWLRRTVGECLIGCWVKTGTERV